MGGGGVGLGGQGGCERKIEVFVKIQKKNGRGVGGWRGERSGWGVRVDVIEELKFFGKFTKNGGGGSCWWGQDGCERRIKGFVFIFFLFIFFFWGGGSVGGGVSGWGGGVRVDVNREVKFL